MTKMHAQNGFSLVTAIFLLAVLAVLMVNIVGLGVNQQATVVMGVQGARAFQAARSALELGIFQALNGDLCNASQTLSFQPVDTALQGFSVDLQCSFSDHVENSSTVRVYRLTATASRGGYTQGAAANPDYVSRRIHVTVSNNPP